MRVSFLGVVERTREEVEMTHFGNKARWSLPQQRCTVVEPQGQGSSEPWLYSLLQPDLKASASPAAP